MLLEMWTAGPHTYDHPAPAAQILFAVRKRRRTDARLSPSGKRQTHRGSSGRLRGDRIKVKFTPRPHVVVNIKERTFTALLDTGSEVSFVNEITVETLRRMGFDSNREESRVQLADGATTKGHSTLV